MGRFHLVAFAVYLDKNKRGLGPAYLSFYSAFLAAVGAAVGAEIFNGPGFIPAVGARIIYNFKKGPAAEETENGDTAGYSTDKGGKPCGNPGPTGH